MKTPAEMHYLKKLRQKNDEIEQMRKRWQNEDEAHLFRTDEMQAKIDELEARLHSKNLAQEDRRQGDGDWLEERLYLQRQELWWLNQRVHRTEEGSKFARPEGPVEERDLTDAIDKAMDSIQFELDSFKWGQRRNSLYCPKNIKYTELGALLRSALKLGDDAMHRKELKGLLARFEPVFVIRVFFFAALREWVFKTGFPNPSPSQDLYLRAYREVVLDFGEFWPGIKH